MIGFDVCGRDHFARRRLLTDVWFRVGRLVILVGALVHVHLGDGILTVDLLRGGGEGQAGEDE